MLDHTAVDSKHWGSTRRLANKQLDQVIGETAQGAEQSRSAGERLRDLATRLRQLAGKFRLENKPLSQAC